jgi:hypothetical protein
MTAPRQERSDAEMALDAARRIRANLCSPKYFVMAEKTFQRGMSLLSKKDFIRSDNSFINSRRFAERAELECLILQRKKK